MAGPRIRLFTNNDGWKSYVWLVFLLVVAALVLASVGLAFAVTNRGGGGGVGSAINGGNAGVGVYDSVSSSALVFRNVAPASSKETVSLDAPNKNILLDVVPAQLGSITINTGNGLNGGQAVILGSSMTLAVNQALSLTSLNVDQSTMLGNQTSCTKPLLPSCYDISNQACTVPLQASCMPLDQTIRNAFVTNLYVSNYSSITSAVNGTNLYVPTLISNTISLQSGSMTCSNNASISQGCLNLGGYSCPFGNPLADSCFPASMIFSGMSVTNTLSVNNVQCLGGYLSSSCVQVPYSSATLGTPSPLTLTGASQTSDLFGVASNNGFNIYGLVLFPVNVTLSSVTISGVIQGNWSAGSFNIQFRYIGGGPIFATTSSVTAAAAAAAATTVSGVSVFSVLGTIAGTLTVPRGTSFLAQIVTSAMTCVDFRASVVVNAVSI
jgi:hypothetical protein